MARKRLTGNTRALSDDWEETLRQIRTQTAVDFTMTGRKRQGDCASWKRTLSHG